MNKVNYIMKFLLSIWLYISIIAASQTVTSPETGKEVSLYNKSWAVIIGINKYEKTRELNYAVKDADSIRSMLIADYKFPQENIKMLTDNLATKEGIRGAINDVIEKAGEDDQILIFFAGHGETHDLPGGGEMGYLLPVESDPDKLYLTAIPMDELKRISGMTHARHVLFLVDACYGGLATVDARSLNPSTSGYLDKITRGKARQIITAGSKGEEVIEKTEWGHSAFTRNILRGLKNLMADINSDGAVTAEELGVYLRDKVTIDSNIKTKLIGTDETLYLIEEDQLVTSAELNALIESDTVDTKDKINYILEYGLDYLYKNYNLNNQSKMGYNRVDGLYIIPGIKWKPPQPNKIAIGLQAGYSFADQRIQSQLDFDYNKCSCCYNK